MNYQDYVNAAKELIKRIDSYQAKIAEYAIKVCEIRHGGRSDGYYTLTDFAQDVGISNKRLSEWVDIYKVSLKVGIQNPTKQQWTNISKLRDLERMGINSSNKKNGTPRKKIRLAVDANTLKEKLKKIESGTCKEFEFYKFYKFVQNNKNLFLKIKLNEIEDNSILALMNNLDEMSDYLNEYLTRKKKSA